MSLLDRLAFWRSDWVAEGRDRITKPVEKRGNGTVYERRTYTRYRHLDTGEEKLVPKRSRRRDRNYRKYVEWADGSETTLRKYDPPRY